MSNKNPRFIKTNTKKFFWIALFVPTPLFFASFAGIMISIFNEASQLEILFAVALIFFALLFLVIVGIGGMLDGKIYGRGVWVKQFDGTISSEQKNMIFIFLQEAGFSLHEENNQAHFSKIKLGKQYLIISELNGAIRIEAFCAAMDSIPTGLYGYINMTTKTALRKTIVRVLDILEAPQDIMA